MGGYWSVVGAEEVLVCGLTGKRWWRDESSENSESGVRGDAGQGRRRIG